MKVTCAPLNWAFHRGAPADLEIILYSHADQPDRGAAGANILQLVKRSRLQPDQRAWDLLSIALSVIAADIGIRRGTSPDGWTREINMEVAVSDPAFWNSVGPLLEQQLRFLTTDLWTVTFADGGVHPVPPDQPLLPEECCVALLSGGLDSLIGALDLVGRERKRPYMVSQVAQGDKEKQANFASQIGGGLMHLQLNHDANCPGENERSQRARSIVFLAYAVLVASALRSYRGGVEIPLYVCENGFIAINPPLTTARLGSLSTRTAHPVFLALFQRLLAVAGLHVRIVNPYEFVTKGEMLAGCVDQSFLQRHGHSSTSCGRFARTGFKHCGRCVPCLIRRASFHAWGAPDRTEYRYDDLSRDDVDHARYDDVRSLAMAVAEAQDQGLNRWMGVSLASMLIDDPLPYRQVVGRGLDEVARFLHAAGVT